jgi:hypothetical protein
MITGPIIAEIAALVGDPAFHSMFDDETTELHGIGFADGLGRRITTTGIPLLFITTLLVVCWLPATACPGGRRRHASLR